MSRPISICDNLPILEIVFFPQTFSKFTHMLFRVRRLTTNANNALKTLVFLGCRNWRSLVVELNYVRLLFSEDSERRQRILYSGRYSAVRQIQVAEEMYEGVLHYSIVSRRRLQSMATQVLPAQQPYGLPEPEVSPAVRSFQQSALL